MALTLAHLNHSPFKLSITVRLFPCAGELIKYGHLLFCVWENASLLSLCYYLLWAIACFLFSIEKKRILLMFLFIFFPSSCLVSGGKEMTFFSQGWWSNTRRLEIWAKLLAFLCTYRCFWHKPSFFKGVDVVMLCRSGWEVFRSFSHTPVQGFKGNLASEI